MGKGHLSVEGRGMIFAPQVWMEVNLYLGTNTRVSGNSKNPSEIR